MTLFTFLQHSEPSSGRRVDYNKLPQHFKDNSFRKLKKPKRVMEVFQLGVGANVDGEQ